MTTNREFVILLRLFIHHLFRRSGLSNRLFRLSNLLRGVRFINLFLFLLVVAVLPLQINIAKKGRQNSTSRSRGR